MKSLPLFLRVYGERTNGVWSLICLEFNLAVQAESLNEAKQKLRSMVKTYITDALSEDGPNRAFASTFLRRRAPTIFWLKYYVFSVVYWLRGNKGGCGSCQQRWPFFHAARFKLIDSLMCSLGGLSQTSLMGCQLRVDRLFQRFGMSRLACSYT